MREYTPPTLTTVSVKDLLELLGPAQGLSSGGAGGRGEYPESYMSASGGGKLRRN
jgi:hypothetical protein